MRILAVHRYYWPDTPPYATILRRIVNRWKQDGHFVEILSSQPSYKHELSNQYRPTHDAVDGVTVYRLNLRNEIGRPIIRIMNALYLTIMMIYRVIFYRYDMVMISTVPQVIGGAAAAFAAKLTGTQFIYHCMDIHPEVGLLSGEFANPLVFKLLKKIDNWTCKVANPIVVLSEDMKDTLLHRPHGRLYKMKVLNNFSLPSSDAVPGTLSFLPDKNRLTVLFAGNIGRFQGLKTVIEAMGKINNRKDIEFIFMGEGPVKDKLQEEAILLNARIRFIKHQPVETAKKVMKFVDAGFVSLVPGMYRYAFPSKTMTYLEQGCPLIVAVEPESKLSQDVVNRGYGFCIPPSDSNSLAELLIRMADDRSWYPEMSKNALQAAKTKFSEHVTIKAWSNLISEINGVNK